jgi:hypothetical protein
MNLNLISYYVANYYFQILDHYLFFLTFNFNFSLILIVDAFQLLNLISIIQVFELSHLSY